MAMRSHSSSFAFNLRQDICLVDFVSSFLAQTYLIDFLLTLLTMNRRIFSHSKDKQLSLSMKKRRPPQCPSFSSSRNDELLHPQQNRLKYIKPAIIIIRLSSLTIFFLLHKYDFLDSHGSTNEIQLTFKCFE